MPECHSTNTLALGLSPNSAEGTVVATNHQTAGRGQRGSEWESAPGVNLTFSVILKPTFLRIEDQFMLNIAVSLGVRDYLIKKTNESVHIKWPNDILVHEKKISGILIENQVQGGRFSTSVVGIGFNLNQTSFATPRAVSLIQVTGVHEPVEPALFQLLAYLETRYLQLRRGDTAELKSEYLQCLYWLNEVHSFKSAEGEFQGTIAGVDEFGRLEVTRGDGRKYYGIKDISFIA